MKKRAVILTTEAHRESFNDFADALRVAEQNEGWRSSEVLRNFLDAGFRAIRGQLLVGDAFDKNEEEYMRVVRSCRSKPTETMTALSRMLAATQRALLAEPIDFIGPVFSELSSDAGMGQFFTPHHLSYMMAKMTLGDEPRAMFGPKGFVSLCELCCGVGGMILASNVALREAGVDVAREAHWVAVDIDNRAVCAAYIQLTMTGCSAEVYRGNALDEPSTWSGTLTPAAALFPKRYGETAAPAPDEPAPIVPQPGRAQMELPL